MKLRKLISVLAVMFTVPIALHAADTSLLAPDQLIACSSEAAVFKRTELLGKTVNDLGSECRVITPTDGMQMIGLYTQVFSEADNYFLAYRQVQATDADAPEYLILLLKPIGSSL